MKRFLTDVSRAVRPEGLGGMWSWLIAGALTFGVAPGSVQAQDAQYGGQGYGGSGHGQSGTGQQPSIAAATLFGLPAHNGRVQWPLGLRLLPRTDETKAVREQLELVLYFVASQAAEGRVNRTFIDFGLQAVLDLRQLLKSREVTMPAFTYAEAVRFLDHTERGLTQLRMMETSTGGSSP